MVSEGLSTLQLLIQKCSHQILKMNGTTKKMSYKVCSLYILCAHTIILLTTDLSEKSAQVIVMEAYGAHFLKEVSRSQLLSAAKALLPVCERKKLCGSEKTGLLLPLARAFVFNNIVRIKSKIKSGCLTRNNVEKIGTF